MAVKYGKKVRELMIKEMEDLFAKKGLIFSNFENIKATEMDTFRKRVKKSGARHLILKKRMGRIAMENAGLSELEGILQEQKNIGVTVIENDPVAIAKLLMGFAKENKNFIVTSGYLEGRVLKADKIKEFSELPGREQLLAMVARAMNAPLVGFVGVLASMLRSVCYVLNALKEKKESGK